MIPYVEGLQAKLHHARFGEPDIFRQRHVEVGDARSIEEATVGRAELAQREA
jgi:hypothetical protein